MKSATLLALLLAAGATTADKPFVSGGYREKSAFGGASSALKTVERFRPPSKNTMGWSITCDDASTWVKPWTVGRRLTRDDEHPVFEYACHEGNEGLRGILSAARAAEKAQAAPRSR